MPISTNVAIQIGGETLNRFSKLVINQKVQSHHSFSVIQPLPKEFVSQAVEKAQSYIGQSIKIEIKPNNMATESPLVFKGIITEAQLMRSAGAAGSIVINGFSPTIAMDGMPNIKSYSDKSLSTIIQEVTEKYAQTENKPKIKIQNDTALPYTVQYGESDFDFIARLAQKKGQWFYYNGENLYYGAPTSKTFTLEYGRSLHSFNIDMKAKPLGFEYIGYDPTSAETQKANSSEINYQAQGFSKPMSDASNNLFPDKSKIFYNQFLQEGNGRTHLVDRTTTQLQSRAADLVTAKGDSDETGLRIGDVVVINESAFSMTGNPQDGLKEQNFGSYIITDVTHVCDEGTYHNTFSAVPESVLSPPYGNVHNFPKATAQPATIIDNNDPNGLGRVQVQMAWQKDNGVNTPWIRMTNPHAGGGKGMYFVPEIGEEVLVGFEGDNAEKPFVLGTMYNGSESSGYNTAGNDQKVIQTRSGTKIIMNDATGSVFIEDPSGNTWMMDGKGNINVNAPNDITMNAGKNMSINVGQNLSVNAGIDISETAGQNKNLTTGAFHNVFVGKNYLVNVLGSFMEIIKGNRESETSQRNEIAKSVQMLATEKNVVVNSAKTVLKNSGEKSTQY
ncbi:type VI secretion system tip protein VgrG [Flavobacterium sp.]|uniref:type VI secretion system Vgr family protein n=1 Tax=Flavobacterium sp. TaxID=239 RepID=UPI00286A2A65|nr:type VI secretion system tip protein VgrG [Flavobacterium sp.]